MRSRAHVPTLDYTLKLRVPFGVLGVRESANCVMAIDYLPAHTEELAPRTPLARQARDDFLAYVRDPKRAFGFPWKVVASEFETDVWDAIRGIPSGQVRTYGDIARRVRSVPRAVGGACGRNPLPLVIPCHRVVAAAGIGGFMGGREDDPLAIKRWLLRHEGVAEAPRRPETLALWDAPPKDARATR